MSALDVFAPEIAYAQSAPVLRDVRLSVAAGEAIAILGGNGAGKSALLQWIAGVLPRRKGRCRVGAADIRSARDAVANSLGYVAQDPNDQLLGATVREDVELGPQNLGFAPYEVRDRVERALAVVDASSLVDRPIESLSLGERKRVSLAGVLAMSPCIVLLDEPTAGLDPHAELALCATLADLARSGITLLVATHAMDLVPLFATRVVILAEGEIVADGDCRTVLANTALLDRARLRRPWPVELWAHALRSRTTMPTLTMQEVLPCLTTAS